MRDVRGGGRDADHRGDPPGPDQPLLPDEADRRAGPRRPLRGGGAPTVALCYFNAAGADAERGIGERHEPETHLVPLAIRAARTGEALTVFGDDFPTPDGTAIRDYVHVADLADAHLRALDHLLAGGPSTALNLGTGAGASIREVIGALAAIGSEVPHRVGPRRPGDPARLVADAGLAARTIGWSPRASLREILASAAAWHRTEETR